MVDILNPTVWQEADASNISGTRPSWPENMPAKDVNDSARAMQGALKRFADQICATRTTAGTGSAYTVAYTVAPESLYNGQRFCVLAHADSTATPTLNINSLGAKTIIKLTSTGVAAIAANDIRVNVVLDLVYAATLNQFLWINSPTTVSGGVVAHTHPQADITNLVTDLAAKAPLASPSLTGTPVAPTAAGGTNTTQIATTAFVTTAVAAGVGAGGAINNKTTSYGLVLADAFDLIEMNVATVNTLTVPLNATQAFAVGTRIDVVQMGAGQTTITPTGGVTLKASGAKLKLTAQYSGATLLKRATDDWYVWGDLSV